MVDIWVLILLFSIFPILKWTANLFGFSLGSNLVLVLLIGVLFIVSLTLTVIVSNLKQKTILLVKKYLY